MHHLSPFRQLVPSRQLAHPSEKVAMLSLGSFQEPLRFNVCKCSSMLQGIDEQFSALKAHREALKKYWYGGWGQKIQTPVIEQENN